MGVGRASEQNLTYLMSRPKVRPVDADRAPPSRRRPVRVRRRRSQRRAERGERSEGGKCPRRFQECFLVLSSRHTHSTPRATKKHSWKSPALNPHHPVRNVRRHHPTRDRRASARCSLGAERGGWGCRVDVRNWGGVTPTWRPHTGSAGAHLQIRSEFRSSELSNR